eukprot:TRINITY_DN6318_c0_g1_i9.p1 TRINITY_DN6318_c0_g1~~TRINITY_DN6318_c0_g1_i9.p1  ORF type:complete len:782 (-),score=106.07 TRINITY_DN6318_c0_g1_i9:822-3167(-)
MRWATLLFYSFKKKCGRWLWNLFLGCIIVGSTFYLNEVYLRGLKKSLQRVEYIEKNQVLHESLYLDQYHPHVGQSSDLAYVTLLSSQSFIPGALSLMQGIRDVGSPHDRVLMHTIDLPHHILDLVHNASIRTRRVSLIENPSPDSSYKKYRYSSRRYYSTYTKFRAWQLVDYRKVIIIDCDITVMQNIDELFQVATPAGTGWYETKQDCSIEDLKDGKRSKVNPPLMVITPSLSEFDNIVKMTGKIESFDGGEFGFFAEYFKHPWSLQQLPPSYMWGTNEPYFDSLEKVKTFHTFLKNPRSKAAEKIWTIRPPPLVEAASEGYVQMREGSRNLVYKHFLKVVTTFWSYYRNIWSFSASDQVYRRFGLAGKWISKGESSTAIYMRQFQSRVFWAEFRESKAIQICTGKVLDNIIYGQCTRLQSLKSFVHLSKIEVDEKNRKLALRPLVASEPHNTIFESFFGLYAPDPLYPEGSLSTIWRNKFESRWYLFDFEDTKLVMLHSEKTLGRIQAVCFLNEGHSSTNVIHGTYYQGVSFSLQLSSKDKEIVDQQVWRLTDTGTLVSAIHPNKEQAWRPKMPLLPEDKVLPPQAIAEISLQITGMTKTFANLSKTLNPTIHADRSIPKISGKWSGLFRVPLRNKNTHIIKDIKLYQMGSTIYLVDEFEKNWKGSFAVGSLFQAPLEEGSDRRNLGSKVRYMIMLEWFIIENPSKTPFASWWNSLVAERDVFVLRLERREKDGKYALHSVNPAQSIDLWMSEEVRGNDYPSLYKREMKFIHYLQLCAS